MNKQPLVDDTMEVATDGAFDCPLIDLLLQGRFLIIEKCKHFVNVDYYKA